MIDPIVSIYVELAAQFKIMDAESDVRRRNTLTKRLREVMDVLEHRPMICASSGTKLRLDLLIFEKRNTAGPS